MSSYYDFDQVGNLWTVNTGTGKTQLSYQDMTAFGTLTAGSPATSPYQFSGGNGGQTDSDSGLVLMGYRYMDTRTGRFISQEPIGDGDNWYEYAGNSPANAIDPSGLVMMFDPSKSDMQPSGPNIMSDYNNGQSGTYDFFKSDGNGGWKYTGTDTIGPNVVSMMMQGGLGSSGAPGGAFASESKPIQPGKAKWQQILVGVAVTALKVLGGAHGDGKPPVNFHLPPRIIVKEEKKSSTGDEEEGKESDKFSFDLRPGLQGIANAVNDFANSYARFQRSFGGGSGSYSYSLPGPTWSNPFSYP